MTQRITLVPRDPAAPPESAAVNDWLDARPDVTRIDADQFAVAIGSADIASQAEVFTARDGEPFESAVVEMATAGIAYGAPLVLELRRFCEELAGAFDLVAETPKGRMSVTDLFDSGAV